MIIICGGPSLENQGQLIGVRGKTFGQMEGCTKVYNIGHVKEPFTRPSKLSCNLSPRQFFCLMPRLTASLSLIIVVDMLGPGSVNGLGFSLVGWRYLIVFQQGYCYSCTLPLFTQEKTVNRYPQIARETLQTWVWIGGGGGDLQLTSIPFRRVAICLG